MVLRNSGRVGSRRLYRSLPRDERGGDFLYARHEGRAQRATRCPDRTSATALRRSLVFLHFLLFLLEPLDYLPDTHACVCACKTLRRARKNLIYV